MTLSLNLHHNSYKTLELKVFGRYEECVFYLVADVMVIQ